MSTHATLVGRVTMDPAAFTRFCETRSMAICGSDPGGIRSGQINVDADDGRIMLEAAEQWIRNPRLLPDLHKAAQAGRVDGAFMAAWIDENRRLEAVVFRNSETWAGWTDCLADSVDIGPCTLRQIEGPGGDPFELFQRVEGSATKHRVSTSKTFHNCDCAGYDINDNEVCRANGQRVTDEEHRVTDDGPVTDITKLMPPRATGQLGQALVAAAGAVGPEGRLVIGRLAWNATGPDRQTMFRRWLGTFKEATGERYVTWVPDLFGNTCREPAGGFVGNLNFRPVCPNPGGTERGLCQAFLVSDTATSDTIRVPAHVDNVSLADAAKLAAGGADPADAIAVIAAITNPGRA